MKQFYCAGESTKDWEIAKQKLGNFRMEIVEEEEDEEERGKGIHGRDQTRAIKRRASSFFPLAVCQELGSSEPISEAVRSSI